MSQFQLAKGGRLRLHTVRSVLGRWAGSVRRNGWRGTMQNVAALAEDFWFDRWHGTETARTVALRGLNVRGRHKHLGIDYAPTRVRAFRRLMTWLAAPAGPLAPGGVLVDFGCGKGRVLCVAAAYPFRRAVGVEFAPELCAVCRENLQIMRHRKRRGKPAPALSVVEADAADYSFAGDETVLFFFNPFRPAVMARVLANLHASVAAHPRRVLIILSNPGGLADALATDPAVERIAAYAYGSTLFHIHATGPGPRRTVGG